MAIDKDKAVRRPGNLNYKGRPKRAQTLRPHKDIFSRCWDANFDPMDNIIPIAQGELRCLVCRGTAEARYPVTDADGKRIYETVPVLDDHGKQVYEVQLNGERVAKTQQNVKTAMSLCRSCYGTGWEHMNVADVLKANEMLLARMYPALKQVDHTTADGSMRPKWEMVIVQSPQVSHPRVSIEVQGAAGGKTPPQLMAKKDDGE